ncbi:MAG: ABC transporter ATP-binding protein [Lachnospiraceae bacterium]|nr:ABC transporter ATP-binding protein [Lachnospiraceae bacterium]
MSLVKCVDAAFAYEGKIIISDLNFEIERGEYLCIVGDNGSGKTTLMKGLLGLIKPVQGEVIFEGVKAKNKNRGIGYLPQQSDAQKDFPASVYEVVLSGAVNDLKFGMFYDNATRKRAEEALNKVKMLNLKNACYRELSGGQKQRVLLARAIMASKTMLLLDEPVSGLDVLSTREMYRLIEDLNKNEKMTIVMISHDVKAALPSATHILHIKDKQAFYGKPDSISRNIWN